MSVLGVHSVQLGLKFTRNAQKWRKLGNSMSGSCVPEFCGLGSDGNLVFSFSDDDVLLGWKDELKPESCSEEVVLAVVLLDDRLFCDFRATGYGTSRCDPLWLPSFDIMSLDDILSIPESNPELILCGLYFFSDMFGVDFELDVEVDEGEVV